jgi:hypothetical protein
MMSERTKINLIFAAIMLLVAILLEVPPRVSNAVLHYKIQKISRGMTEEEASRLLGKESKPHPGNPKNMAIIMSDRSNPLSFVFPWFEVNEHHTVNIVSGRVDSVSAGGLFL